MLWCDDGWIGMGVRLGGTVYRRCLHYYRMDFRVVGIVRENKWTRVLVRQWWKGWLNGPALKYWFRRCLHCSVDGTDV